MKRVCVFCGSSPGSREQYSAAAQSLGRALAERELELVFGGGKVGLMGIVADAVMAAGGRVIGVMPQALVAKEIAHRGLTELIVVGSMHERKARMADLADGFIALPGGFGTYDELCEILTWAQLGFHRKPTALLNVDGFYDSLLSFFDHATQEGFVRAQHRQMILVNTEAGVLLDAMREYQPTALPKWITHDEL